MVYTYVWLKLIPGPATDIKANMSKTSLAVSWTAPTGQNITGYKVELRDVANTQTLVEETRITFDNISPGTYYTVVVVSMNDRFIGQSAVETFTTSESLYFLALLYSFITIHVLTHARTQATATLSIRRTFNRINQCTVPFQNTNQLG